MSEGYIRGVNQAGKAPLPDEFNKPRAVRRRTPVLDAMMAVLSAFGNIVSPIKEDKPRAARR